MINVQKIISTFYLLIFLLFVGDVSASFVDVNPIDTTYLSLTLCESDCPLPSPLECISGIYSETLTGATGCDSVVIINLTIVSTVHRFVELCPGDCIEIPELDSTFCPSYTDEYAFEFNGCTEALVYFINVDFTTGYNIYFATCMPGECIFTPFSDTVFCPTSDTVITMPAGNCGGVNTYYFNVFDSGQIDSFIFYSCPDECIEWEGGIFCNDFSSLDTYVHPATGCDSSVYFEAKFYSGTNDPIHLGICEDECITWNGIEYCDPVNTIDSLVTSNGCDSIVNIISEIIPLVPALLPPDTAIDIGAELYFNINLSNFTVFWNSGIEGPDFIFDSNDFGTGFHPVFATIVENSTGCLRLTDTTIVEVIDPISKAIDTDWNGFTFYPNPIEANQTLQFNTPSFLVGENMKVTIYDNLGIQLVSTKIDNIPSNGSIQLPAGIAPGIYLLELIAEKERRIQKIIVQ